MNGFAIEIDLNKFEVLINLTFIVLQSLYSLNNTSQVKIKLFSFFFKYDIFKQKYTNFTKFGEFNLEHVEPLDLLIIIYECSSDKAVTNLNEYYFDLIFVLNKSNHK